MYSKIRIKTACKIPMENLFSSEKKTIEFFAGQMVEGRIDRVSNKTTLMLEDGWGGEINQDFVEIITKNS